jgi:hypothetical protein
VDIPYLGNWTFSLSEVFNGGLYLRNIGGDTLDVSPGPTDPVACEVDFEQTVEAGQSFRCVVSTFDVHKNPTTWDEDKFSVVINDTVTDLQKDGAGQFSFERVFERADSHIFPIFYAGNASKVVGGGNSVLQVIPAELDLERTKCLPQEDQQLAVGTDLVLSAIGYDQYGNEVKDATFIAKIDGDVE